MNEIERAIALLEGSYNPEDATTEYSKLKQQAFAIAIEALKEKLEREENPGEVSDGYHTFNELYHHRAVLFSVICNERPDKAWKSKLHHDGTMFNGMFIVGIETPDGQATYHYDINPYWDIFKVPELPKAPEWDGHTSAQAIERIGKLPTANDIVHCKDCKHLKNA